MTLPPLVFSPHPLMPSRERELIPAVALPGETLAAYFRRAGIWERIKGRPVVVTINGLRVPRELWARCKPKPGTSVHVQAIVRGGDNKNPIALILSIGLMFVAPYLAVEVMGFAAGSVAATIAGAAISFIGNLAINALFPAPQPHLTNAQGGFGDNPSPTYSISGGGNRMRPYEPMPVIVGTCRVFPDLGARPYTEFQGEDMVLYQVFELGYNDVDLSDYRIGENPIGNYPGVTIEESGPDGRLMLFPGNVDSIAGGTPTIASGPVVRVSSPNATALAIEFTGSIFSADSADSHIVAFGVQVRMEYRAVGSAVWLAFAAEGLDVTIVNASRKPVRRTYWRQVPEGQYEVRVTRESADDSGQKAFGELTWSQLRTYQPDPADYTGRKRIALKITASGQLQGSVAQFNCIARAKTLTWNGAAWVTAQTSNPAYWVLKAARGQLVGGRRMWGAGLADARIGLENLKAFAAWCQAQGLTANGVFDQPLSVQSMLDAIALRGRGTTSFGNGKLEVVWDAPDQPAVDVIGMSNIKLDSFSIDYMTENLADEVVGSFFNAQTAQRDSVRALAPGVIAPVRSRSIELFLCDNPVEAGQDVNLYMAANEWRTRRYKWRMDWAGMPFSKGDVSYFSHDLASTDFTGRLIEGSTAAVLKLERKVPLSPGGSWIILVKPNGTFAIYPVQGGSGDSNTLNLVAPLAFNPGADPNHPPYDYRWLYGYTATPNKKVKIESIVPKSYDTVELTAIDEGPEYYASKNNPYLYTAPRPVFGGAPQLSSLQITEEGLRAANGYLANVILTWDASGDYGSAEVFASVNGGPLTRMGETRSRSFEFPVSDGSDVTVQVTAFSSLGRLGQSVTVTTAKHIDFAALFPPSNVANFDLDGGSFTWREVPDADAIGYRIRFHYGVNFSWEDASPLGQGLITHSPHTPPVLPSGTVTFLIVAEDAAHLVSPVPTFLIRDLGDPAVANVLEEFPQDPAWPGTKVGCAVAAGELEANDSTLFWGPDDALFWGNDAAPFWPASTYTSMTYEFSLSPSLAAVGSAMTIVHDLDGTGVTIEYRRSSGPGLFWGADGEPFWGADASPFWPAPPAYQAWPGAITAENEQYDFRVSIGGGAVQGVIREFTPTIDVPDLRQHFDDIAVPPEGLRLALGPGWHVVKGITFGLQNDGGAARQVTIEDKNPVLGPLVKTRDNAFTPAAGVIDADVFGY